MVSVPMTPIKAAMGVWLPSLLACHVALPLCLSQSRFSEECTAAGLQSRSSTLPYVRLSIGLFASSTVPSTATSGMLSGSTFGHVLRYHCVRFLSRSTGSQREVFVFEKGWQDANQTCTCGICAVKNTQTIISRKFIALARERAEVR
jgi:hypothetical protein